MPAVLAELRPDLPTKFVQWLCGLLEFSPEKRPESAVEALASLSALNPPPPPVPPESFRPRPATTRPALPIASGIVKPPPKTEVKPASAILQPPRASEARSASQKQAAKPAAGPVKKSHPAMTVGLFSFLVILIAGGAWFFFLRNTETKYPGDTDVPRALRHHRSDGTSEKNHAAADIGAKARAAQSGKAASRQRQTETGSS